MAVAVRLVLAVLIVALDVLSVVMGMRMPGHLRCIAIVHGIVRVPVLVVGMAIVM